jgi:hypothetical protein
MAEHNALAERDQAVRLDALGGGLRDPEPLRRPPKCQVAGGVGGGHEQ